MCKHLTSCIYVLSIDVNECAIANGGCEQVCINTEGSFYCDCHEGQILKSDDRQCKGKKDFLDSCKLKGFCM